MRTVEAELHQMLLDIVPSHGDSDAQARIIAEASAIYKREARFRNGHRTAAADTRLVEAQMMDALLKAMGQMAEWDDVDDEPEILDVRGMSAEQVVRAAGRLGTQYSDEVVNPEDFDVFFFNEDEGDTKAWDFNFADGHERVPYDYGCDRTSRFTKPGYGKHRSDNMSNP